mgnify:FL=1
MNKAIINKRVYNVITVEEYFANTKYYDENMYNTAICHNGMVYPLRKSKTGAGCFIKSNIMGKYLEPPPSERDKYLAENAVIDFDSNSSMKERIETNEKFKNLEREILCSPDDIYMPKRSGNETPEMDAFKTAIELKQIDIDKYASRMKQFSNNKRLMSGDTITLSKIRELAVPLDMKVTLILEDASDDVPNPIGRPIITEIVGKEGNKE